MSICIDETNRRRKIQEVYNEKHGIKPVTVKKQVSAISPFGALAEKEPAAMTPLSEKEFRKKVKRLEKKMREAAGELDFESAAKFRDEIHTLKQVQLAGG
jgi:excinuclease ABC subunit B